MFTWYTFRVVILVVLTIFYIVIHLSQRESGESLSNHNKVHHGSPVVDEDAFARSIMLGIKSDHQWQFGLMVVATVVLAIFDSHYYMMASTFCAVLAAAHFYFGRRINV